MAWKRKHAYIPSKILIKERKTEEWKTMGVIGAGRACGVTHFVVWTANWLQSVCKDQTAVLECNDHGDFQRLLSKCRNNTGDHAAEVMGVSYYPEAGNLQLMNCMNNNYKRILIDYGEYSLQNAADWLRCDKKILIGSFSEWRNEKFLEMLSKQEPNNHNKWVCAAVFGSEELQLTVEKELGVRIVRLPYAADAFTITRSDMDFLRNICMC